MQAVFAVMGTLVGLCGGAALMWLRQSARDAQARAEARRGLASAGDEASEISAQAQASLAEQKTELRARAVCVKEKKLHEIKSFAAEVDEREGLVTDRETDVEAFAEEVEARGQQLDEQKTQLKELRGRHKGLKGETRDALERVAGATAQQCVDAVVEERLEKAQLVTQIAIRDNERRAVETAPVESRRLMSVAMERYSGVGHLERIQNSIAIPDANVLMAFADPEGEVVRGFVEEVDCELRVDEAAGTLTVRGDDPLAREIARRVVRQVANRAVRAPDKIAAIARQVKSEVDREVQNAGRKAFRLLQLDKAHPEVTHLVGRLKYRLSYSQNQWKHSVEVAYIAGTIAQEMGLNVNDARRGGLLHDIGKAMTHDHEGSHAVLGAEVARRCGEAEVVANAIGSHHNDEPQNSAIAHLVTAADAISGARPGARREAVTLYLDRIRDIQRIASEPRGVCRVDVMQAGREVRVVVAGGDRGDLDPNERTSAPVLPDDALHPLAQEIARAIEEEITFPGQIRVTVIRESRAVTIAH